MIDLEAELAPLVAHAPEPPAIGGVTRRASQRRLRRRGVALTAALIVIAAGVGGTIAIASSTHHPSRVSTVTPPIERVRVALLDGAQLEISGPTSLGLTKLAPAFNAELDPASGPQYGVGHSFSVVRDAPTELGEVIGRYPTHDGHELVVYSTADNTVAVVQYPNWTVVVPWNHDPTDWARFAAALNGRESADGFLIVEPADSSWHLGPSDAPDVQLGAGNRAAFQFYGPATFPVGCPEPGEITTHTAQGWPAAVERRAMWCDPAAHVRIWVTKPHLFADALQGLRVDYTGAAHAVANITTLDGSTYEVTAPSSVLDQLVLQAAVTVDGIDEPNLLNTTPNALPVSAERAGLPSTAKAPSYPTADGHELFSYTPPTDCGCEMLAGTYGQWLVEIEVTGMSTAQRTQIASLFRADETPDGFLTLDPASGMHVTSGPGDAIVLDGVDVATQGLPHVIDRDPTRHLAEHVHVRRIDG